MSLVVKREPRRGKPRLVCRPVDGLSVSEFLIQLARQQIEGKVTMEEVTQKLNEHYEHSKHHSSTYEIVPPDSEIIQQIKDESCW